MHEQGKFAVGLEFLPVTAGRWDDLVELFGENGACAGCWCMWWRLKRAEFSRLAGEGAKNALRQIVESGQVPGILAYAGGRPVGWCSVAPRQQFPVLDRSPILKRVDEAEVWSIVCFFVPRRRRGRGIMTALLQAAVRYAAGAGATIVEGYPIDAGGRRLSANEPFTGLMSAFIRAGFIEVARRSPRRPIMRLKITETII